MTDYDYDVFISYRKTHIGKAWVAKYFQPCLKEELQHFLGREARIYFDEDDIPIGAKWPKNLINALATSKCIVPVFCGVYFNSEWCSREFGVFYNREKECRVLSNRESQGLILPVLVRDGDHLPNVASEIQNLPMSDYYTRCSTLEESISFTEFEKLIQKLSNDIYESLKKAPKWDKCWIEDEWVNKISIKEFHKKGGTQLTINPTLK